MGLLDNFKRYIRGEDYESDEYDEFDTPEESAQTMRNSCLLIYLIIAS